MADTQQEEALRALLVRAADLGPAQPVAPARDLARRGARQVRTRRLAWVSAVSCVAVAAVLGVAVVRATGDRSSLPAPAASPSPVASATADQLARGHWSALPAAPITGRADAAYAWTGTAMLVWGGRSGMQTSQPYADGASYDPKSRTWSLLPPSPLSARFDAAFVWTGHELVVWGGYTTSGGALAADGAAYNPATHVWRELPPSPLPATVGATALWDGSHVVVVGGVTGTTGVPTTDLASYDPTTDAWTSLPPVPQTDGHTAYELLPVVVGHQLWVWSPWQHSVQVDANTFDGSSGSDLVTLELATRTWSPITSWQPPQTVLFAPIAAGDRVLMPPTGLVRMHGPAPFDIPGVVVDATGTGGTAMAHGPLDDMHGTPVWTGAALFLLDTQSSTSANGGVRPGDAAVWDPVADRWTRLPAAPPYAAEDPAVVWTGTEVLVWGSLTTLTGQSPRAGGYAFGP